MKDFVQFYMDIGYSLSGFEEVWGDYMDQALGIVRDVETGEEVSRDGACKSR